MRLRGSAEREDQGPGSRVDGSRAWRGRGEKRQGGSSGRWPLAATGLLGHGGRGGYCGQGCVDRTLEPLGAASGDSCLPGKEGWLPVLVPDAGGLEEG